MVKFIVGVFEMSEERRRITQEMLAQAFGDNWEGFTIMDPHMFEDKHYTDLFVKTCPKVDLAILDGDIKVDKFHPYEFTGGFTASGAWAFWGTSGNYTKEEATMRAGKLIEDINTLSRNNPKEDNHFPLTRDINFIF